MARSGGQVAGLSWRSLGVLSHTRQGGGHTLTGQLWVSLPGWGPRGLWGPLCCGSSDRGQRAAVGGPTCPRLHCLVGSLLHEHESAAAEVVQVVGEVEQRGVVEGAVGHLWAGTRRSWSAMGARGAQPPRRSRRLVGRGDTSVGPTCPLLPGAPALLRYPGRGSRQRQRVRTPGGQACATAVPGTAAVSPRPSGSHLPRRHTEQTRQRQVLLLLLHTGAGGGQL